jgi:hypothetical protein
MVAVMVRQAVLVVVAAVDQLVQAVQEHQDKVITAEIDQVFMAGLVVAVKTQQVLQIAVLQVVMAVLD